MMVCASSMKRMIGFGEAFTSAMTAFRRFSNSPFTPAPAWRQPEVEADDLDVLEERRARRPATMSEREALDERRLADARLADDDRVVLPAPARGCR